MKSKHIFPEVKPLRLNLGEAVGAVISRGDVMNTTLGLFTHNNTLCYMRRFKPERPDLESTSSTHSTPMLALPNSTAFRTTFS